MEILYTALSLVSASFPFEVAIVDAILCLKDAHSFVREGGCLVPEQDVLQRLVNRLNVFEILTAGLFCLALPLGHNDSEEVVVDRCAYSHDGWMDGWMPRALMSKAWRKLTLG